MKMKSKFLISSLVSVVFASSFLPEFSNITTSAGEFNIYINEVCTQNKNSLVDSYGLNSDWIELYNSSDSEVDLSGYGLSDKVSSPLKWTFPANTVIKPKEYLIVFASKQASTLNEMHTGFALSKNGETLTLSNPYGDILQQVVVPTLGEDDTYGRTPDGSDTLEIMKATPGKANTIVVSVPTFSASSGFYGTNFSLALSSEIGTEIYYTLDGSDPTNSDTAQLYSDSIMVQDRTNQPNLYSKYEEDELSAQSISHGTGYKKPTFLVDKATIVRAVAKNSDGIFSDVVDQTYFVTTGNLAQYENATVISLVTNPDNFFDSDNGIYVAGNQYLEWKNSSDYDPDKSVWDKDNVTNFFSKGRAWEREANVTIFENGSVAVEQGMGVRIKGASTRNSPQKNFNLYARSDYGASKIKNTLLPYNYDLNGNLIDKYDSVSLRAISDETRLRDGFAQKLLYDRENIVTQAMKPCVVFLNGEYWGLYEMTEKLSDYFVETNYGIPKENVAMIKSWEIEEGPQEECDKFYDFMYNYSYKDLTNELNYQAVCDFVDIDTMIEHYAAGIYLGTYDWPNYNYGVWRNMGAAIDGNKYSDGKWRFISYDFDYTMGATYEDFGGVQGYAYDSFKHMDNKKKDAPTNLFVKLLANKEFRDKFISVYCDYANEVFSPDKANMMADYYSQNYTDMLANSQLRWWGFYGGTPSSLIPYYKNTYQNTALRNIKTFFNQRADYTLEDMKEYLNLDGEFQTLTLNTNGSGIIKVNSITPHFSSEGYWSGKYFSDVPVTLTAIPDENSTFKGWSGDINETSETITITLSEAMNIQANFDDGEIVKGDVNADGIFSISDIVMMQKWLLNMGELTNYKAGDLTGDNNINIFDLCMMKYEFKK